MQALPWLLLEESGRDALLNAVSGNSDPNLLQGGERERGVMGVLDDRHAVPLFPPPTAATRAS